MSYNATVYEKDEQGQDFGTFVAEVAEIGGKIQMLRSNFLQYTGYEGKVGTLKDTGREVAIYDLYIHQRFPDHSFTIVQDNCEGYKNRLSGMSLPPAYTR